MEPIDLTAELEKLYQTFGSHYQETDMLSHLLYPKVFSEYHEHRSTYGNVEPIPTPAFFYGLEPNEEIMVEIQPGKRISVKFLNVTNPNEQGNRLAFFRLNGQTRAIEVHDRSQKVEVVVHKKAVAPNHIGAPLQGSLSKVLVSEGDVVEVNAPLFVIEAMKMESTITAPRRGVIGKIHLTDKTLVEQDDLVLELISE
jgi:pyruvate carboxylase